MTHHFRSVALATILWASATLLCTPASAAIIAYNNFDLFQTAASGTGSVITFDNLSTNNPLTFDSGVTFTGDPQLRIYIGDTVSGDQYVGGGFGFARLTDENIGLAFDSPVSAAGLFVIFDNAGAATTLENIRLTAGGVQASTSGATAFEQYDDVFEDGTTAFFIGLVDNTGANSISSAALQGTISSEYNFDSVTSFSATAVPEPSSLIALGCIATGIVIVHRRNTPRK